MVKRQQNYGNKKRWQSFQTTFFVKKQFKSNIIRCKQLKIRHKKWKLQTQKYFPCRYKNNLALTLPDMPKQFH